LPSNVKFYDSITCSGENIIQSKSKSRDHQLICEKSLSKCECKGKCIRLCECKKSLKIVMKTVFVLKISVKIESKLLKCK
jgi:hypothetical protein